MAAKNIKNRVLQRAGLLAANLVINTLVNSVKIMKHNYEGIQKLDEQNTNYILAFWHGTMLIPWFSNKGRNFSAIVSQSKDGEILTRVLKKWKYNVIREAAEMVQNKHSQNY